MTGSGQQFTFDMESLSSPTDVGDEVDDVFEVIGELVEDLEDHVGTPVLYEVVTGSHQLQSDDIRWKQSPEDFTEENFNVPLLRELGFTAEKGAARWSEVRVGNTNKKADGLLILNDEEILIEHEPLGKSLSRVGHGVSQASEWLQFDSASQQYALVTNGLEWVLLYYDDVRQTVEPLGYVDLTPVFSEHLDSQQQTFDDAATRSRVSRLIRFHSYEWMERRVEQDRFLTPKQEQLSDDFYRDFVKYVFGGDDAPTSLVDVVESEPGHPSLSEEDRERFGVRIADRLVFIEFLEDLGLIKSDFLFDELERYQRDDPVGSFYSTRLSKIFKAFRLPVEDRDTLPERWRSLPYIPGGPFRPLRDEARVQVSDDDVFEYLITELLEGYRFSMDDDGDEVLNPRVLGDTFEKVINDIATDADRQSTGAFYTPDKVTDAVARQAIRGYTLRQLQSEFGDGVDIPWRSLDEVLSKSVSDDVIRYAEELVKELKIVDPACGSGHFLVSVLDAILDIRLKIAELLDRDVDRFELKREIVENNIFGVDIESHAVEIAQLRLWLSLAEEIESGEARSFPNIEYDIRTGNSLIGAVNGDEQQRLRSVTSERLEKLDSSKDEFRGAETGADAIRQDLDELLEDTNTRVTEEYHDRLSEITVKETVEDVQSLPAVVEQASRVERLKFNFSGRVKGVDEFDDRSVPQGYSVYKTSVAKGFDNDYDIVERVEEHAERIRQCLPADVVIEDVEVERRLEEGDIESLSPIHWQPEFTSVFTADEDDDESDPDGFDIVIGNPPHGADVDGLAQEIVKREYELTDDSLETTKLFIERSAEIAKPDGEIWYVIPKASGYSHGWRDYRQFCRDRVRETTDLGEAFPGVDHEQVVVGLEASECEEDTFVTGRADSEYMAYFNRHDPLPREAIDKLGILPTDLTPEEYDVIKQVTDRLPLIDDRAEVCRGYSGSSDEDAVPALKGRNVQRFYVQHPGGTVSPAGSARKNELVPQSKVVVQNIVSNRVNPAEHIKVTAHNDVEGVLTGETVTNIVSDDVDPWVLTLACNSRFLSWYVRRAVYANALRDIHVDGYFVERFPIPDVQAVSEQTEASVADIREMIGKLVGGLTATRMLVAHGSRPDVTIPDANRLWRVMNGVAYALYLAPVEGEALPSESACIGLIDAVVEMLSGVEPIPDEFPVTSPSSVADSDDVNAFAESVVTAVDSLPDEVDEVREAAFVESVEDRFPDGLGSVDPGDDGLTQSVLDVPESSSVTTDGGTLESDGDDSGEQTSLDRFN